MIIQPEDYRDVAHDARKFRDLRRAVRSLPEPERFNVIMRFVDLQPAIGWWLANACLRNRIMMEQIFRHSLAGIRPDWISVLLRWTVPRIGLRRAIRIVSEHIDSNASIIHFAVHALNQMVNPKNSKEVFALERLTRNAETKGALLGPKRVVDSSR